MKVEDVVSLGDEILVKALGEDKKGRQGGHGPCGSYHRT